MKHSVLVPFSYSLILLNMYSKYLWIKHQLLPSSSSVRSLPLLSMPEVCELPWLVVDELQVRRGLCGAWPGALKLSVSMPEVCELPWLVVEWRDRRLWWETLPALLPLALERLSRWSMSSSRASLMYDSLYCFFSEISQIQTHLRHSTYILLINYRPDIATFILLAIYRNVCWCWQLASDWIRIDVQKYLRFPPADGLVWGPAAGSCRAGGCCWAAAGGGGSEWDNRCSRWACGPKANRRGGFQISFPERARGEGKNKKKNHMNVDYRTLWFIASSNIRLWNRNVDFKLRLWASKARRQTTEEEQSLLLKLLCSQTQCSNQLIYLVLRPWNDAFLSSFGDSPGRRHVGWMHGKTKMADLCFLPFFWQRRASITAVFSVSGVVFNADL